jgi:hypothetical protein
VVVGREDTDLAVHKWEHPEVQVVEHLEVQALQKLEDQEMQEDIPHQKVHQVVPQHMVFIEEQVEVEQPLQEQHNRPQ